MKKTIALFLFAMFFVTAFGQNKKAAKELKPLVDKYIKAWNTGNVDLLNDVCHEDFARIMSPTSRSAASSLQGLKGVITGLRTSYPDFNVKLVEVIYLETKVISRYKFSGTNTGPGEIAPTGKKYSGTGISISNFKNGKFIEEWAEVDNLSTMLQLGYTLTPPAEK